MNPDYQQALLYLLHLLINADGVHHQKEAEGLELIHRKECISPEMLDAFYNSLKQKTEQEIYCLGTDLLNKCSREEKLNAFALLYKMSEVDGRVHVKEIRLLLYSLNDAGITFDDVVNHASQFPSFLLDL